MIKTMWGPEFGKATFPTQKLEIQVLMKQNISMCFRLRGCPGDLQHNVSQGHVTFGVKGSKTFCRCGTKITDEDTRPLVALILSLADQRETVIFRPV